MIFRDWRAVCPDITITEYRAVRATGLHFAVPLRPMLAAAILDAYREGMVAGFDRAHAERAGGLPPSRRGWPPCHCRDRRLRIECETNGHDRSVELLTRWGYPVDDRTPPDLKEAAAALERAWP